MFTRYPKCIMSIHKHGIVQSNKSLHNNICDKGEIFKSVGKKVLVNKLCWSKCLSSQGEKKIDHCLAFCTPPPKKKSIKSTFENKFNVLRNNVGGHYNSFSTELERKL